MSDAIVATTIHGSGTASVRLAGQLVFDTAQSAKPQFSALLDAGCRRLIVDASELDLLDSSGLGILLATWQRLTSFGGGLEIRGAHGQPARMLSITGSDLLLVAPEVPGPGGGAN